MRWVYLGLAIGAEGAGSVAFKQSAGFTRPGFAFLSVASFAVALFFLSLALRTIPRDIANALWTAIGTALGVSRQAAQERFG